MKKVEENLNPLDLFKKIGIKCDENTIDVLEHISYSKLEEIIEFLDNNNLNKDNE